MVLLHFVEGAISPFSAVSRWMFGECLRYCSMRKRLSSESSARRRWVGLGGDPGKAGPPALRKDDKSSGRAVKAEARGRVKVEVGAEICWETASLAVKRKVLPSPTTLSTQMVPCMSSTMRLEMARPRPVPPYLRVVEESAWEKFSKILPSFSWGMPMPVSLTRKRRRAGGRVVGILIDLDGEATGVGELHGVAEEVEENLAEACWVSDEDGRDGAGDEGADFEALGGGFDAGEFEDAVDDVGGARSRWLRVPWHRLRPWTYRGCR